MSRKSKDKIRYILQTSIVVVLITIVSISILLFLISYKSENRFFDLSDSNPNKGLSGNGSSSINQLDTFTVNLLSDGETGGRRVIKIDLAVEMDGDNDSVEELMTKKAILRDTIINQLSTKTSNEVMTVKGKDKLKEDIKNSINNRMNHKIKNIYITNCVIG